MVDPLTEIVPAGWGELVRAAGLPAIWDADVVTCLAWCAQHATYLGLVTDRSGTPAAVFHTRHFGMPTRMDRLVRPGRRAGPGLVECRLPPAYSMPGHAFAPGLDASDRAAAVAAFERALGRRLGRRAPAIAYRVVFEPDLAAFQPGRRPRLSRTMHPDHVVEVRWPDIDGYLASLPPGVRREVRRRHRRIEGDPNLAVAVAGAVPTAAAARLAETVRRAHRPRWWIAPPIPTRYFELLTGRSGVRFVTYTRRGELAAFELVADDGTDLATLMWGSADRIDRGREHLYFDKHLRTVGYAIEHGRRRVRMGKGFTALKGQFGAQPQPVYLVIGRL